MKTHAKSDRGREIVIESEEKESQRERERAFSIGTKVLSDVYATHSTYIPNIVQNKLYSQVPMLRTLCVCMNISEFSLGKHSTLAYYTFR